MRKTLLLCCSLFLVACPEDSKDPPDGGATDLAAADMNSSPDMNSNTGDDGSGQPDQNSSLCDDIPVEERCEVVLEKECRGTEIWACGQDPFGCRAWAFSEDCAIPELNCTQDGMDAVCE